MYEVQYALCQLLIAAADSCESIFRLVLSAYGQLLFVCAFSFQKQDSFHSVAPFAILCS